ncbi:hypothetical protein AMJ87_13860 [candidate division WOR_3 bacterium SM23_60]|uniref:PTS EIIA type-2 domain-containing protein n=1 Tax=candidate division WOR_3 bacterium SM23_60 TaxID=1703780 RepID=A0A0S8G285_UNCW3|nr:MAG: hypothetical protein AMJ87_13860 [candidate division WOR_3 bacterium SM23_60]
MALKKELGLLGVFAIASGAMISSGLFILPGLAFQKAGPAMVLSYIIAGILVLPTVFSKAELVTAMPKAGGDYFYITRSMGAVAGTIAVLASWFSLSLVAILVLYVIGGFTTIIPGRFTPFAPHGVLSIFSTAGLVFISFGGLTKVASVAEEVRNPKINVPVGMLLAYFVVLILYVGVAFITVGVLNYDVLQKSLTPVSDGARVFWGITGVVITAIAAMLAFVSTANAGIMSASRYPLAMSRDHIAPAFFTKVHKRFKTPYVAIVFTTLFMVAIISFLDLEVLVEAASTMLLLLYISANLSVIVMRESKLQNYQPSFHSPLYPYGQIVAILGYGFLIYDMGRDTLMITAIFIACALLWYFVYVKPKISGESALMYVVERVTDRQIVTDTLKQELREIVKEREEIIEDEFDHLIKDALILDIDEKIHFNEFIKIAAEKLSQRISLKQNRIIQLFIEREKQSCTALRPGLAIPHIIIDGENKFDILAVRAREGITFPDASEPVHIVFALIGTRDMRNLHLRALMAIAQITEQTGFDKKWLSAQTPEDLRDIVLLGKRKRA